MNRSILKESFWVELSYNENILMRRHFYETRLLFFLTFLNLYTLQETYSSFTQTTTFFLIFLFVTLVLIWKDFFFLLRYQDLKITTIDSFVATARKTDKAWTSIKDLFVVIVVKKFLLISFKWSCQISELESFFLLFF